ncbi:hypothetical protein A3D84_04530 [Candidatus Woesebacteria bacterium RIFCSPHIGHO2_02_FULL_42_20]|uniref:DUF4870 domain-containing protein n=1 Tax=Candidatus Woesebacteria bacterium RIFCSPHIGHO2_12_FULL_41_24 TaxID=1802510 RepID=A0A1F8AQQ7_9BACT|nr:MAG: hypothetical protein A2W15_06365 [Candidatus Woesebacteria bacterium RBG_16_41_13]OGM28663.1 MAG: hypothetical protein A2873_05600 [Candidatus Woesebacteria bacterium RIFCSPHIGHO2_01_FULL_42_80]OGM34449.1 MAG: hypothetical protein A3D84_04530 [Candidatus Woesebacteria bacterium RIFCSPHIGHO2_02_FULL_42_20]OGM54087.1 MAG: hypothetical protein A3E44_02685 [Candidatus Woesebacteria bacterium RIFCSPHIGHO2_12_FULL_41_24]OGM66256.1 MAG: hypothetical protein A2969_01555 [Candidatus Woesebacteri
MLHEGTGLPKNSAAALSVLLGPTVIIPVIFLILERDKFVRFHAMQSTLTFLFLLVAGKLVAYIPVVRNAGGLVWIVGFTLWLVLSMKAWNGQEWEVPLVGKLARKFLGAK